jgi:nicotinamidase-related amidase
MTEPSTTALLVMDVQNGIVKNFPSETFLPRLASAIAAGRKAGLLVIYVGVKFRPGHPEIDHGNKMWAGVAANNAMLEATESTDFAPQIAPQTGDVVVTKRRVGAFSGSDLEMILRSRAITNLVLTGISTSGVVLSTVRLAADRDFGLTVLSDGVLDADEDVHRVLVEKLFPRQCEVLTVEQWIKSLLAS